MCGFIRRLGNDAQIGPRCLPATRILFPGFVVGNATADDDVVAGFPVRWCRDWVPGSELKRIKHSQDFVEVSASAHRVAKHQLDLLVGSNYEHGAYGGVRGRSAAFGSIAGVGGQHVIKLGYLEFRVPDHGIVDFMALGLFDVYNPLAVTAHGIHTQSDDLAIARYEEALAEAKKALALDPVSLTAQTNVAITYYRAGRYDQGVEEARRVLDIETTFAHAHYVLGRAYVQKGIVIG